MEKLGFTFPAMANEALNGARSVSQTGFSSLLPDGYSNIKKERNSVQGVLITDIF